MWQPTFRKYDIESGTSQPLYPMMLESPELRWSFIRKIYSIVAIQLLLTVAVGAAAVYVRPVTTFFLTTSAGSALYILLIITPFIGTYVVFPNFKFKFSGFCCEYVCDRRFPSLILYFFLALCPLSYYYQHHPVNYILLGVFTVSLAFAIGLSCAFTNGMLS